eukprot:s1210_g2.t1
MEEPAVGEPTHLPGYDPTVEVTTDEPPLLVPGLHSSAFVGPGSSAPPESPSEMPVPTEMPTSPVSDLGDYTVPTAPTRVEPTVLGGVPPTADVDEVPVLPRSSGMVSSVGASSPTEADIAVPTEKPTSPTSPMDEHPLTEVPHVPEGLGLVPEPSAAMSESAPLVDSPEALPVPTELPSPATSVVEGTVEVPTAPDVMELPPRPELGESDSAIFGSPEMVVPPEEVPIPYGSSVAMGSSGLMSSAIPSPSEMPVPTEMPTSPAESPQDLTEAVTRDTRTLGTNVPTVSGDEWRARTVEEATEIPLPQRSSGPLASSTAVASSGLAMSPSEMPVPTELPTSPMEEPAVGEPTHLPGYDPTREVTTDEPPLLVPGLHSSAFLGPGSSAAPGSPSEMPVPTEMPTSPMSDFGDDTVPTAPTRVEPTVLGGVPPTADVDEVPVLPGSSGVVSSVGASSPTEADIAVPTEKPTSPTSPMDEHPLTEVPHVPEGLGLAPEPSAAMSESAPPVDSPEALPVPTELPSPATSVVEGTVGTIEAPTAPPVTQLLPQPELNFSSAVIGESDSAVFRSPDMPVPTELPSPSSPAAIEVVDTIEAPTRVAEEAIASAQDLDSSAAFDSGPVASPTELPVPTDLPSPTPVGDEDPDPTMAAPGPVQEPTDVVHTSSMERTLTAPSRTISSLREPTSPAELPVPTHRPSSPTEIGPPQEEEALPPLSAPLESAGISGSVPSSPDEVAVPTELSHGDQ